MPPQNQQPYQNPGPQGQYDFIMNTGQTPKRSNFDPGSTKARILLVVGGLLVLIILFAVVNAILGSGGKAQQQRLIEVAQAQAEIVRTSGLATEKAKTIDGKNYASTIKLATQSSQLQTKTMLEKRGLKGKAYSKVLAGGKNSKTDATLDEAGRNNRYDETYAEVANQQMTNYQKLLKSAYDNGSASERKTLKPLFDNAGKLATKKTIDTSAVAPPQESSDTSTSTDDSSDDTSSTEDSSSDEGLSEAEAESDE